MQAELDVIEVNVGLEEGGLRKLLHKQSLSELMIFNQESSAFESQDQQYYMRKIETRSEEVMPKEAKLI